MRGLPACWKFYERQSAALRECFAFAGDTKVQGIRRDR
jgi:hypothetical protein